ncbi:hypothetical protein ACFWSF_35610 [Streptomyces sp. NPDC058611]|uniref:hypothetical protein n=1 Tax=unclassified Streptomyces TaxID=2593676 RepID=UPI00366340CC
MPCRKLHKAPTDKLLELPPTAPKAHAPYTELSGICAYFCVRVRLPATTASKATRVPRTKEELTHPRNHPTGPTK